MSDHHILQHDLGWRASCTLMEAGTSDRLYKESHDQCYKCTYFISEFDNHNISLTLFIYRFKLDFECFALKCRLGSISKYTGYDRLLHWGQMCEPCSESALPAVPQQVQPSTQHSTSFSFYSFSPASLVLQALQKKQRVGCDLCRSVTWGSLRRFIVNLW